jgi:RNA polymerase sigma-70 factor, ECF subfamily
MASAINAKRDVDIAADLVPAHCPLQVPGTIDSCAATRPAKFRRRYSFEKILRPRARRCALLIDRTVTMPGQAMGTDHGEESPGPRTFASVLRAQQSMVFSIAYHFLRDRSAAEEVAQEVFLQLHRRFDELKSEEHITSWLRKVASHRCIDYVRKQKSQAAVGLDHAPEPSVDSEPQDHFMNRRLQSLIGSLPEKSRMVMILRYQEDLMPEEIASVMDMPVRTVKSHLQRSLALLREKIDRSMGDVR